MTGTVESGEGTNLFLFCMKNPPLLPVWGRKGAWHTGLARFASPLTTSTSRRWMQKQRKLHCPFPGLQRGCPARARIGWAPQRPGFPNAIH